MYKNGIGLKKIAKILDLTELEVNNCLNENGIVRTDYIYADRDFQIIDLYSKDINIVSIARKLGINRHTVTDVLKRSGIYRGNKHASNFSKEKLERNKKIISLYKAGFSFSQIAKRMNISSSGVKLILKTFNIDIRPQHMKGHSKGTTKNRKYFFNLDFFSRIDTEEKAYWLGFLYADGYVNYNGLINISLQERDKGHLEKFKKSIQANNTNLKYSIKTKSFSLSIRSVKTASDLIRLGCKQKKSLILKFPTEEQVPCTLINHFMRGYFDGDGCICITNLKSPTFSVLGTKDFLDKFEEIMDKNISNHRYHKRIHKDSWKQNTEEISRGGRNQLLKIMQFLYKDSTIYLERKYDKFNKILQLS